MRKAIFAVLVVLLALLAVSCDSAILPIKSASGPDQPAPEGHVTLRINVGTDGRARAMESANASGDTDYYEVVFLSPKTNVYRQTFYETTPLNGDGGASFTMTVAEGDYDNSGVTGTGKAILFAGKRTGAGPNFTYTLLGVGTLTDTDGTGNTGAADTSIVSDTTSITFTVHPLTTAVTTTSAVGATQSSFLITAPNAAPNVFDSVTHGINEITISSDDYPLFEVPMNIATTASYKFSSTATASVTNNVLIKAAGSVYLTTPDATSATALANTTGTALTTGAPITPNSGNLASAITSGFTISFTPANTKDLYFKLWIEVPVIAVDSTTNAATGQPNIGTGSAGANGTGVAAGNWYIRGGINNDEVDTTSGGKGGAVLLKTVDPNAESTVDGITITP